MKSETPTDGVCAARANDTRGDGPGSLEHEPVDAGEITWHVSPANAALRTLLLEAYVCKHCRCLVVPK